MGQILRAVMYDHCTEDSVPALEIGGTPLNWYHLDDGVMGGKSQTTLTTSAASLHFAGTINTNASVGWASARATLPPEGLPSSTTSLKLNVRGDGKTYKILLMDPNHESRLNKTPLWEANLPTKAGITEELSVPLTSFIPSFMAKQLSLEEKAKYQMNPSQMTKIGFMLSSKLADGSSNPIETYGKGVFDFSLFVKSLETVEEKQ